MTGIFITGATGNVGSRLVKEYLTKTTHTLYLLVRGSSQAHAEARMQDILLFWDIIPEEYPNRLKVMMGDIVTPGLGLTSAQTEEIRQNVSWIIHAASNLRLDLTWEKARYEIVGGTENLFDLAESLNKLQHFGYISSLEVIGRYRGVLTETFLTNLNIEFLNNYELGKFVCEEFLREKIEQGFPATIMRIGMVVGEHETGKALDFQSFYMLTEKYLLNPDLPILADGALIDPIPVDFLAQCIVKIMEMHSADGRIYHLSHGLENRPALRSYLHSLKPIAETEMGQQLRIPILISPVIFRFLVRLVSYVSFGKIKKKLNIWLIFLNFLGLPWLFDNKQTKQRLAQEGLFWPNFDEYMPRLIKYYISRRSEKRLPF